MDKIILIWADSGQVYYVVNSSEEIREDDWLRLLNGELDLYKASLTKVDFESADR